MIPMNEKYLYSNKYLNRVPEWLTSYDFVKDAMGNKILVEVPYVGYDDDPNPIVREGAEELRDFGYYSIRINDGQG